MKFQFPQGHESAFYFPGEAVMAEIISTYDWSATLLGAAATWPQGLRNAVSLCLHSPSPMMVLWGAALVQIYNRAFTPLLADKHPVAMGKPSRHTWPELCDDGAPMVKKVMSEGQSVYIQEQLVVINNEQQYYTFSCIPLFDEANPGTPPIGAMVMASNVTAEVASRKRLNDSETRLKALVSAAAGVVYHLSADWKVMQHLEGRGFLPDAREPMIDWLSKYVPSFEQPRVQAAIDAEMHNKSVFELEHQVLLIDGTIGWTFSRAIPIFDDKGAVTSWLGAASDITARKHAEEDAASRKSMLEAITGATPDLVYVFDLDYTFSYANKALLTMWGLSWEESMGKRLLEVGYEPWHAEMHEREIDEVVRTKKMIRGEVSFPHAELGRRIYDYIFAPVFDAEGNVTMIAGTTRDISELKKAEEALMHSEEQFRSLTQSLPQLIWTARMDGYCDFFNKKWYDYTGATPESSFGDGWAQYIHEDQRNGLYASWRNSLETGAPVANEFQLKGKDGAYRWFNVLGNPIRDEEGKILRWVGALTNIDEHRESKERLEKVVQDRTRELMRSNEDLQQFAHVASHDLKEPLRKIKFYVDRLQHDADTHLSTQGQASLGKIVASAERMSSMIEGVLSYSSTSAIQAPMGIVDLNNVLHDITTELEIIMQQKGATVSYHELPVVEGAEVLLYQLFYNLVFNSLKFARKGTPPVIQVDSSIELINGQQMAKTVLRDNGIGFAEQYAGSIFHTFTRLNSKDRYEGTGLGLSLCKKIVERHHGQIEASGEENVGATFTVWLPLKQQA